MEKSKFITRFDGSLHFSLQEPSTLSREIKIDLTLYDLLATSCFLLGKVDGCSEFLSGADSIEFMYLLKEVIYSCQLEGSRITLTEYFQSKLKSLGDFNQNDIEEISNYIKANDYGLKEIETLPLSIELLKEINEKLTPKKNKITCIESNLTTSLNTFLQGERIPALIKAGILHSEFMNNQVFLNTKGKLSRILVNLYLHKQGVLKKPLLCLSEYFKKYEHEYFTKLNSIKEPSGTENWLKFFLSGIITTANSVLQTAIKLKGLRESNSLQVKNMGKNAEKGIILLKALYERPFVSIKDVEEITSLKNPNALSLVSKFVKLGILEEITGQKRNRIFAYQEYLSLFK